MVCPSLVEYRPNKYFTRNSTINESNKIIAQKEKEYIKLQNENKIEITLEVGSN